ncbi:MAG: phenylalanine--tRNA ligase subunit beta [Candidatus Aminicenantes bacterium]|nr:phenylalanine--tRNA ligase subunit beta [Candidatus Aminicenantes bacterium]
MKISVNWLKDHIDLEVDPDGLIDILNNIGLMVDGREAFEDDTVLDIETYANRPDTLGHRGIAREIGVKFGLPLKELELPLIESSLDTADLVDIQILNEDLCPRYTGLVVKGVRIEPSSEWLQKRLRSMSLNPVNNVVDISNFVLFDTAQPIHTFDLGKIAGNRIIVRKSGKGESLLALDGKRLELDSEMLVIADENKPVALAGVIGGMDSSVTDDTTDIFIESAFFHPRSIRSTAKKTGLQTDASYRFERNTDIAFPPIAARMAASLLCRCGGKVSKGVLDVYPAPAKNKTVVLRRHRIRELLGLDVEDEFIVETLKSLEFQVEEKQPHIWQLKVPSFRIDIEREADVIEEIARFFGYDKIPTQLPPIEELEPIHDERRNRIECLRQIMFHQGYDEVVNLSFTYPEEENLFHTNRKPVVIRNPISTRSSLLRTTLSGGLLQNIAWNRNRGAEGVQLFEIAKSYYRKEDDSFGEDEMLACATTGLVGEDHWHGGRIKTDFFSLKGTCEALMANLRYGAFLFKELDHECFKKDTALSIHYKGQIVGCLGEVNLPIRKFYSIKEKVWLAELNLTHLFAKQPQPVRFSPISRFPSVERDLSIIIDKDVVFQDIRECVDRLSIPNLEKYVLVDKFSGKPVPDGKASLSFRFVFRHSSKTLLAEDVDSSQKQILAALRSAFNIQLREGESIDK